MFEIFTVDRPLGDLYPLKISRDEIISFSQGSSLKRELLIEFRSSQERWSPKIAISLVVGLHKLKVLYLVYKLIKVSAQYLLEWPRNTYQKMPKNELLHLGKCIKRGSMSEPSITSVMKHSIKFSFLIWCFHLVHHHLKPLNPNF